MSQNTVGSRFPMVDPSSQAKLPDGNWIEIYRIAETLGISQDDFVKFLVKQLHGKILDIKFLLMSPVHMDVDKIAAIHQSLMGMQNSYMLTRETAANLVKKYRARTRRYAIDLDAEEIVAEFRKTGYVAYATATGDDGVLYARDVYEAVLAQLGYEDDEPDRFTFSTTTTSERSALVDWERVSYRYLLIGTHVDLPGAVLLEQDQLGPEDHRMALYVARKAIG